MSSRWEWLKEGWERALAVTARDGEEERLGRLFNMLMIVSIGIVTGLSLAFLLMPPLGLVGTRVSWLAAAFPLTFVPLSLFSMRRAKGGQVRSTVLFYVWVNVLGIAAAVWVFDGLTSPGWVLFIWSVTVAGTLLDPEYALWMTGGVMAYYLLLAVLSRGGLYSPPLTFGPAGREVLAMAFLLIMLVSSVGLLTFLNMRSLRDALGSLQAEIAERHRIEGDLRRHAATLERRNQELQRFSQVAAHDLQEPLRLIVSYLQLLERRYKGSLDSEADAYIEYAVGGAKRLQALMRAVSEYSQATAPTGPFGLADCEAVWAEVQSALAGAIQESGAVMTHDPLPRLVADAVQLGRLFRHLLENALLYRAEATPCIHVSARQEGDEWVFSVRDNGIGFEPQYRERIFGLFQRLHGQEVPGTGVGLAICRRIVEDHGGRIWADSELGKGSTFYFALPERGERP